MVGGAAVGLVALVGAIILVLKNVKKTDSAEVSSPEPKQYMKV